MKEFSYFKILLPALNSFDENNRWEDTVSYTTDEI